MNHCAAGHFPGDLEATFYVLRRNCLPVEETKWDTLKTLNSIVTLSIACLSGECKLKFIRATRWTTWPPSYFLIDSINRINTSTILTGLSLIRISNFARSLRNYYAKIDRVVHFWLTVWIRITFVCQRICKAHLRPVSHNVCDFSYFIIKPR